MTRDDAAGRLDPEADAAAIRGLLEGWRQAVAARDPGVLASLIDDDAMFMAAGRPPIRGRAEVEAVYRESFAKFAFSQQFTVEELQIAGDWAFVVGVDSATMTPLAGGETIRARGMGLSVLRRQADGGWRFWRGINNMSVERSDPSP